MASLSPYTFVQELDNNGAPLAGGKIYTYAAGTSTPKATYKDSSGLAASLNTNPIILDSAGRADIWLDNGGYKLIIKTSADVTIETVDNVVGSGTGSVGFVSTMADLRALQSGAYDSVTLTGYTTVGDGGEGTFYWSAASVVADNAGTVIQPNSTPAAGRWIRIVVGKYTPMMFGTSLAFLTWAVAQTVSKSIAINSDLNLAAATIVLPVAIDLAEFTNGAKILNGTLTISTMSARPMYQVFDSTVTVTFAENAIREANTIWFGTGATGYTKLVAACALGNISFIDSTVTDGRNAQKFISGGVVMTSPLFNPLET